MPQPDKSSATTPAEESHEISISDAESNAEGEISASHVADLQARLKQAEDQVKHLQTVFKQAQANLDREADELRARLRRGAEERLEAAKGDIFKRILEVADNLEWAIQAAESVREQSKLLEGVKATHTILLKQLEMDGVRPLVITPGDRFNPQEHEAVDLVAVEAARDGCIIAVYKSGYLYGERLLRPAMVRVGRSN